ncbi:trypsin-like serine protease [Cellulomonas wangsupingiae]|uniref:trypsin-like serine protease n=1 Tax=Cellulomonas wangsupingiae TaxID=2968085 RepID=UPI001D0EE116|nr:trypsin-like serine protease [Cellulomonas wangsupingiae]MCC2334762.1 S1 family peptidase [Cellulomonas wangsupingiae]
MSGGGEPAAPLTLTSRAACAAAVALGFVAGSVPVAHAVQGDPATGAASAATVKINVGEVRACSGALLNESWVITAKACFADTPGAAVVDGTPKQVTTATVGRADLSGSAGHVLRVERLVVHPERDVVLARLASPVTGVAAVAVATDAPVAGEKLTVTGYGRTSTQWVPDTAHAATFTVETVGTGTLDIQADEPGSTICKGDGGGPALRTGASGTLELVAIHHTAHQGGCLGQTASAQGATETRVDDIRTWITWNATLTQKTPVGHVDAVVPDRGQVTIRGWAWDPDTSAPINVHIYIDGVGAAVRADLDRPDIGASQGTAPARGFTYTRTLADGDHTACVYGINVGTGSNPVLGCYDFSINTKAPIGVIEAVVHETGQVSISGWAWDPDTPAPTDVHIYIDGVGVAVRADRDRPDVAASHGTTPTRGYSHTRALAPGEHTACVYAINIGPGDNTVLGCRTFSVDTRPPVGAVDGVSVRNGQVSISGWAWDPDTSAPTDVHIYIDGVGVAVRADQNRPDVAAAFGTAPTRGYSHTRAVSPGSHTACIYAINIGRGDNTVLGCRTFSG